MTKFRGSIGINRGYKESSVPGDYQAEIEEIEVVGEIRGQGARWPNMSQGENVSARHVLSIVTPESTIIDYSEVVYILWQGLKWSVVDIQYKRPRIDLTLGGLYNG